jgi:hypothetical protein
MMSGKIGHHADGLGSLTREQEDTTHAVHYSERGQSRERHARLL